MTIGVASVILLIAVGNGSSKSVEEQIRSLGTNLLEVSAAGVRGGAAGAGTSISFTKQDANALQNKTLAPDVKSAAPVVDASSVELVHESTSYEPTSFVGTTPSYLPAHDYKILDGTSISALDVSKRKHVLVIAETVAEELGLSSPVGTTIQVNGTNYEVVGVLATKSSSGTSSEDEDVIAPITAVEDTLAGYGAIDSITVEATSEADLNAAEAEVRQILEQRHKITDTAEPGFEVANQGSLLETSSSTSTSSPPCSAR